MLPCFRVNRLKVSINPFFLSGAPVLIHRRVNIGSTRGNRKGGSEKNQTSASFLFEVSCSQRWHLQLLILERFQQRLPHQKEDGEENGRDEPQEGGALGHGKHEAGEQQLAEELDPLPPKVGGRVVAGQHARGVRELAGPAREYLNAGIGRP